MNTILEALNHSVARLESKSESDSHGDRARSETSSSPESKSERRRAPVKLPVAPSFEGDDMEICDVRGPERSDSRRRVRVLHRRLVTGHSSVLNIRRSSVAQWDVAHPDLTEMRLSLKAELAAELTAELEVSIRESLLNHMTVPLANRHLPTRVMVGTCSARGGICALPTQALPNVAPTRCDELGDPEVKSASGSSHNRISVRRRRSGSCSAAATDVHLSELSSVFSRQQHFSIRFLLPNTETNNETARDRISQRRVT
jgi:hypothetical protein